MKSENKLQEKVVFQGKTIEVVEKAVEQAGAKFTLEFARRSPGTRLIIPKGDKIILSRELRHELGGYDYRLPGGKVYDTLKEYKQALEEGADINKAAEAAAIKEAREEAGVEVKDISFFHKSVCGATVVWDMHYFVVNDFTEVPQELGEGEDIKIELINRDKVRAMCLDGTISEERSALVLMRYLGA